jgi:Mg-chelatase subunit ChlI
VLVQLVSEGAAGGGAGLGRAVAASSGAVVLDADGVPESAVVSARPRLRAASPEDASEAEQEVRALTQARPAGSRRCMSFVRWR